MSWKNFLYLFLLLIFVVIPLALSLKNRIRFAAKFKYLLPAILFAAAIFIIWDIRFTEFGIWSLNTNFLTGLKILDLPIEKWVSFFIIPYTSLYIYEILNQKLLQFDKPNLFLALSLVLLVVFVLLAYFFRQKLFTFFTFFLLSIYFGYTIFRNRFKKHYTKFYGTFFIVLIPYLIFSELLYPDILSYDAAHIIGIRLINTPVENLGYLFLLLLMITTIYEYLKEKQFY